MMLKGTARQGFRRPARPLLWFAAAAFLYACLYCFLGLRALPDERLEPKEGELRGVAMEDGESSLLLRDAVFSVDGRDYDVGGVRLWAAGVSDVRRGQSVRALVKLSPIVNQDNPGAFNTRRYCYASGISYSADGKLLEVIGKADYGFFGSLRRQLQGRVQALWPERAQTLNQLLLGDGEMEEGLLSSYRASGAAHVLAVSGLHVGFVAALLSLLFCFLPKASLPRFLAESLGLLAYCLLTGAGPSTQRAALMAAAVGLARLRGRAPDGLSALGLAAGVILLFEPRQLLSLGFQLSVSAMLGVVLLTDPLQKALRRLPAFLRDALSLTLAAQAGCLPATLSAFGSAGLYSPLTNLLAVPLAGLAVPLGLISLLLDALWPPLATLPALLCGLCAGGMDLVAQGFAALPHAQLLLPKLPVLISALWPPLLLVLIECRGKLRLFAGAGLAAGLLICLGVYLYALFPRDLTLTFLQVGCADSLYLRKGAATVAVDTGRSGSQLANALQAEDPTLDALILSHGDADHCGGTERLLRDIRVRELCYPKGLEQDADFARLLELAREAGVNVRPVAAGDELVYDGIRLQVLSPPEARPGHDNEDSLVLRVVDTNGSALLTADADGETLAGLDLEHADILKLPHHGSRSGLDAKQVRAIGPRLAVLSVGGNPYGLPAQEALDALGETPLCRTDEDGAVRVFFRSGGPTLVTFAR